MLWHHDEFILCVCYAGVSRFMEESEAALECSIVGTMVYIAPEVLQGKYKLSADIYSLGVVGWMTASYAVTNAYFHVSGSNMSRKLTLG